MAESIANVTLSADFYAGRLVKRMEGRLAAMRIVLRALDDGSYLEQSAPRPQAGFVEFRLENLATVEEMAREERRETLLAIVRAFVDFVDTLIAIKKISSMPQQITKTLTGLEELRDYIEEMIELRAQKVGKDGHLSSHEKKEMFKGVDAFLEEAITGLFELRTGLEHHKGIAQAEISLCTRELDVLINGETKLEDAGFIVQPGQSIVQVVRDVRRTISRGAQIDLSEHEIDSIVMMINLFIVPDIAKKMALILGK